MLKNPFSFTGRIRRLEFGLSYLFYFTCALFLGYLADPQDNLVVAISFVLHVPLIWFGLAQGAKRCHDIGNSGWYQLIPFYILVMFFRKGETGRNRYGRDPKAEVEEENNLLEFWEKEPGRE